jgi:23S rRNA pseudouridine2604 synthase
MSDFSHDDAHELFTPRIRLNKFLADRGICSRRDADLWIESGRVTVNGELVDVGTYLDDSDQVRVDGELVAHNKKPKRVYIALHKPIGIECTTDQRVDGNIVDFVQHQERVFPIGRLDKDSDGLILLTNDGDIVNKILRAEHNHEKEYWVTVDRKVTAEFLREMANGVQIMRRKTRPCRTYKMSAQTFGIVLTEGMNRQIRKMSEAFGYRVQKLTRVRIMNIEIGHLKPGRWRNLTPVELSGLQKAIQQPKTESDKPRRAGARTKPAGNATALYRDTPRAEHPTRSAESRPLRVADARATRSDARPVRSNARPVRSDARPVRSDARPVRSDARPVRSDARPVRSDARPARSDARPVRSDARPVRSDARPVRSDARPVRSDARPVRSDARPVRSDARPVRSDARPVRSDVRPVRSDARTAFGKPEYRDARRPARGGLGKPAATSARPARASAKGVTKFPSSSERRSEFARGPKSETAPAAKRSATHSKPNFARSEKSERASSAPIRKKPVESATPKRMTVKDLGWDD